MSLPHHEVPVHLADGAVARDFPKSDSWIMSSSLVLLAGLRCEHDRVVLAWSDSTSSGEDRYCAGDAWEYGWIQGGWPPRAPSDAPPGPRSWFGLRPPAPPRDPFRCDLHRGAWRRLPRRVRVRVRLRVARCVGRRFCRAGRAALSRLRSSGTSGDWPVGRRSVEPAPRSRRSALLSEASALLWLEVASFGYLFGRL